MSTYKVVVAGPLLPNALNALTAHCEVRQWQQPEPPSVAELAEWLQDAEGLVAAGGVTVHAELLAAAPKLRVIAQASVGYDNIDIAACTRRKIPVGNTPGVLVEATADLTFGLMLAAARRIHEGWDWVRAGKWEQGALPLGIDLYEKTVGIVGMGSIGAAVAKRAQASGMKVIYHNRRPRPDQENLQAEYCSFPELLSKSDFVVVLTPLTAENRHMFSTSEFAQMKSTAYFINAARGGVVDTQALYTALVEKQIAYAALDVTDPEPLPAKHLLVTLPNILIVPHIGSATVETRDRMAMLTAQNLLLGLAGKPLLTCVNPEVNYR